MWRSKVVKVSVLMAVYKTNLEYLKSAIESILNQTYKDFEFLIVDDCSQNEQITNMLNDYAKQDFRVKVYKNENNMGISATRNKLLSLAVGEYVAVMDHDDISLSQRLEREVEFLDNHPDVGVVGCWYEKFPKYKLKKRYVTDFQIKKDLMFGCAVLHPSSMLRKSILDKYNIKYEKEFSPAEDYALWVRLIDKTKFANIPEVLFKYRDYQGNTSKTQKYKMEKASKEIHAIIENKYSKIYALATNKQTISFCGLPIVSRQVKGCQVCYKILNLLKVKRNEPVYIKDCSNMPIYIISFNRLSYLQKIIEVLERYGLKNIHIIDNASTYPPLLEYLKKTPYKVYHMSKNYGHKVFFEADEFKKVRENSYFVLTDPDVVPTDDCPADFMDLFYHLLKSYPKINKVGFSLKTDDLPEYNVMKSLIMRWEKQYYKKAINNFAPIYYNSAIDTTFAMYRPQKNVKGKQFFKAIRVGKPYEARHLPWYKNLNIITEEDKFYNSLDCGSGNWNTAENIKKIEDALWTKECNHWYEYLFSYKYVSNKYVLRILGLKLSLHKKLF